MARESLEEPKELLDGLRAGDERSYEELVRRYGGRMLSVARRIVRNEEDARDCVQESFLQAFKRIDAFEGRSTLGTWLHRIAVNNALLKLRSRRRHPETPLEELMPIFDAASCRVEAPRGEQESVEALVSRNEVREAVRDAIQTLPEDYRNVLILRDIAGFDTQETAEHLQIKAGAVKTRLHRARSALKRLLEPTLTGGVS